jgi:hypothetical protein
MVQEIISSTDKSFFTSFPSLMKLTSHMHFGRAFSILPTQEADCPSLFPPRLDLLSNCCVCGRTSSPALYIDGGFLAKFLEK